MQSPDKILFVLDLLVIVDKQAGCANACVQIEGTQQGPDGLAGLASHDFSIQQQFGQHRSGSEDMFEAIVPQHRDGALAVGRAALALGDHIGEHGNKPFVIGGAGLQELPRLDGVLRSALAEAQSAQIGECRAVVAASRN